MGKDIFISYIIPCYNIQDYLPRCLASLSRQHIDSGAEVEFVLVNDGSPDNCLEILKEFALKDPRAIVIDQKNQGVSAARNAGLKEAKGKYVFFLDGDDSLTDDASQILFDASEKNGGDIIVTNAYKVNDCEWDTKDEWNTCGTLAPGQYDPMSFAKGVKMLPISFKAYRRDLLIENNITYDAKLRVGEVFAFFIQVFTYSSQIVFSDKRMIVYTRRRGSVMRTIDIERDSSILLTMNSINDCVKSRMPQLGSIVSYNRTLFKMINLFGVFHYVKLSSYTKEIGQVLNTIYSNDVFKGLQRYFLLNRVGLNRETVLSFLFLVFPVSLLYPVLRLIWKRI